MNWDRFMIPIVIVFGGFCMLLADEGKWISTLKKPKDVYTCDLNELKKGDRIKLDITAAYECVMANESITYHGDEEEIKELSRYYAIPLIEENENSTNIYSFLVVEVSEENYSALDTATRLFEGWWND